MKKITIAIDGYSSCGKSTMAKDLAREIGYVYVDTGAMYRAVTLFAMRNGLFAPNGNADAAALERHMGDINICFKINESTGRPDTMLNGENVERDIRTIDVSKRVSQVAALPFVRSSLVAMQQAMGKDKGVVMDGRDIGTTVFPDAELKVFVTRHCARQQPHDHSATEAMAARPLPRSLCEQRLTTAPKPSSLRPTGSLDGRAEVVNGATPHRRPTPCPPGKPRRRVG